MTDKQESAEGNDLPTLEEQVKFATLGDRSALEFIIQSVQKDIYNLALRFLWHPQDAEDASQEILIRVITSLDSFRGESQFKTWVYRVATNALLTIKKQRMERTAMSLDQFAVDLAEGLSDDPLITGDEPSRSLLLEEVKIGCTHAMLQSLDRAHRVAYILGEIMELDHQQASFVLEVSPAAYRKRLSRARSKINIFMEKNCGLINSDNACRCERRVDKAVALKRIDPSNLLFASSLETAKHFPEVLVEIRKIEKARRSAALYQSHPKYVGSDKFTHWLRDVLDERPEPKAEL